MVKEEPASMLHQVAQGLVQLFSFEFIQGWKIYNFFWQHIPGLVQPVPVLVLICKI